MTHGIFFLLALAVWILVSFSMTQIIIQSTLFKPIRDFLMNTFKASKTFLICMLCMGAWTGFLLGGLVFSPTYLIFTPYTHFDIPFFAYVFMDGIFSSAVVWFLNVQQTKIERGI